ncbi:Soluble hydrogenase 42 kDa subunit [Planctomycetes bacterium Pan216]|uniref:Soluble hydrogenase 42 kDa subunit n=1 Tax=Kolteria novifilia TaxID=2527975 RepID=A0A518BAA5_9BACT|nr:Soluble hydrogenase 42 kDa subunit [Planctomycetes bacterium Pan216]
MKYRLMTPGPSMVPPETLLSLAKPVIHHRTPENKAAIAETLSAMKKVFCTENDLVIFASSGTGAMETSVANFVKPGDKAIALVCGKWGERWEQLLNTFGAELIKLEAPYGKAPTPADVEKALAEHPDAVAVYATLSETSTGVRQDIEKLGAIVAKTKAVFVVDGISGVGTEPCRTDDWNVDLLVTGSQKALMMPPGLAFLSVSAKAKARLEEVPSPPTYYFNLKKYLTSIAESDTPYTPAHTLIAAQAESLKQILDEGVEESWERHRQMSLATHAAVKALGLETLADPPAAGLTVIKVPESIDGAGWAKLLEKKYALKVAGGQGSLKGKIIRIAHMGYVDALDMVGVAAALEWTLAELGYPVESGKAVAAATAVFAEGFVPKG